MPTISYMTTPAAARVSVMAATLLGQELPGLLLDEGDIPGHVFLQSRSVVFEIDGD